MSILIKIWSLNCCTLLICHVRSDETPLPVTCVWPYAQSNEHGNCETMKVLLNFLVIWWPKRVVIDFIISVWDHGLLWHLFVRLQKRIYSTCYVIKFAYYLSKVGGTLQILLLLRLATNVHCNMKMVFNPI